MLSMIHNRALFLTLISALHLSSISCVPDMSSDYGVVTVTMPNNLEIYFKREVRGLSYDTLVLSPNKSVCDMPNSKSDYIYPVIGPLELFYKVEGNSLILYGTFAAPPPEASKFPVSVVQHEFNPSEFSQLKMKIGEMGLKRLEVNIDKKIKCD